MNEQTNTIIKTKIEQINEYYKPIIRSIELLNSDNFTSVYILSKAGLGKSTIVDQTLEKIKADYVVFSGDISDAKLFEFLQKNSNKIIIMRDVGRLLKKIGFIEMLKSATDPRGKRIVSRMTYAKHEGVEESFSFNGKIVLELNDICNRYKEDLEALFSRGMYIELNFSIQDIINIMKLIADTKEKEEVTDYLIKKSDIIGNRSFNLRTQNLCFRLFEASKKDKLDWKKEIDLFLNNQIPESRKLLYRFAGYNQVNRMNFVRYLMKETKWSYPTCQRRISEWIYLGEISSDGKLKRAQLSLNEFKKEVKNETN